jgi:hypothetical protein
MEKLCAGDIQSTVQGYRKGMYPIKSDRRCRAHRHE